MEPRSWQWIQGAVIAAAMAIGIAVAVWYENRPIASPLPIPTVAAKAPKKQKIFVPPDEGIVTGLLPDKPSASVPVSATKGIDNTASVPAPSQDPTNAWQKEVTDPMAHTSTPATISPPIVGTPPPAPPAEPPVDTGTSPLNPSSSPSAPPPSDVGSPPVTAPVTDTAPADSGPPAASPAPTTGTP